MSEYKQQIETELAAITKQLQSLGVQNPTNPADWIPTPSEASTAAPDPNDLGDRSEDWQEQRATLDQLETRYNNLIRARNKIANGTFGVCEISGKLIEDDRLAANPAARTCKAHIDEEANLPN